MVSSPRKEKMITVNLTGCENGLGMKIIGGLDPNGNYTGIFVKQILPDGIVDNDGQINLGDLIYSVNGYNLNRCSQTDAISYLRLAAQTGDVSLVVDNSHEAQELFLTLFERPPVGVNDSLKLPQKPNDLSNNDTDLEKNKRTMLHNPIIHSPPSIDSGIPGSASFTSQDTVADYIRTIFVLHKTSLGISIRGGLNDPENPNIYIGEIINGGDVFKDGTLKEGDIIISINGESFVGITNEQAKSILSRIKLKKGLRSYQISYVGKANKQYFTNVNFPAHEDRQSNVESSSPKKTLPILPLKSPRKSPKHLESLPKAFLLAEPEVPDHSLSTERFQSMTSETVEGKQDDSLLKELFDVMADIQENESEMEQEEPNNDVFATHYNSFSPNIISTPHRGNKQKSPQHKSISHYLKQDAPSSLEEVAKKKARRSRDLSLDAGTTIKLEKLEGALQHLGLNPSMIQKEEIRKRLKSDIEGNVSYGDFVSVAREVLHLNGLTDRANSIKTKTLKFQKSMMDEDTIVSSAIASEEMASCRDEIYRLRRERDDALKDAQYYRGLLHDRDEDYVHLEDELENTRQQVAVARRECNSLRYHSQRAVEQSKYQQETQVQETIRKLEKENSMLRTSTTETKDLKDLQKRLVVLGCQLRKTEVSKRAYEVAVDKLTKFVEKVHLSQDGSESSSRKLRKSKELSTEAKETIKNVKMLLEEEPLPFGWEEVYTPDGTRYYMNHVTQTTSWVHPISSISRKPKAKSKNRKISNSSSNNS